MTTGSSMQATILTAPPQAWQVSMWKTGLKIDYRPADTFQLFPPRHWLRRGRRALFGDYKFAGTYDTHPDPRQEAFFFGMVRDALEDGEITEAQLRDEIAQRHFRPDALELIGA